MTEPNNSAPKSTSSDVVGAGMAGGGIGAVIAALADSLPDSSVYKSALTISAPIIAVGISGIWLFVKAIYIDPYVKRKKEELYNLETEKIFDEAESIVDQLRHDKNATDEDKSEASQGLVKLRKIKLQKIIQRMNVVSDD